MQKTPDMGPLQKPQSVRKYHVYQAEVLRRGAASQHRYRNAADPRPSPVRAMTIGRDQAIGLVSVPMPSIVTVTMSPGTR